MKKPSKLEELINVLYFWFVPPSFIRYVHKMDKNIRYDSKTKIAEYISASAFELLRLAAYYGLATNSLEKYL